MRDYSSPINTAAIKYPGYAWNLGLSFQADIELEINSKYENWTHQPLQLLNPFNYERLQ